MGGSSAPWPLCWRPLIRIAPLLLTSNRVVVRGPIPVPIPRVRNAAAAVKSAPPSIRRGIGSRGVLAAGPAKTGWGRLTPCARALQRTLRRFHLFHYHTTFARHRVVIRQRIPQDDRGIDGHRRQGEWRAIQLRYQPAAAQSARCCKLRSVIAHAIISMKNSVKSLTDPIVPPVRGAK